MAVARSIFTLDGALQLFWAAFDMPVTVVPLKVALGYKNKNKTKDFISSIKIFYKMVNTMVSINHKIMSVCSGRFIDALH